jgi:uncharacterized protein (DUF983 family)
MASSALRLITVSRRVRSLLTDTLLFRSGGRESRDTRKNRYSAPPSWLSTKSNRNPAELIIFFIFMPKNHAPRSFNIRGEEIALTKRNGLYGSDTTVIALVACPLDWQSRCMTGSEKHPHYESWPPPRPPQDPQAMPSWSATIGRGLRGRCPRCGKAPIFDGYLKVYDHCINCKAPLGDMPADDAPPYIAMTVLLQLIAIFVVLFYKGYFHPGVVMAGTMLLLLVLACLGALRLAKGAVIGILLKLGLTRERVT